MRSGVPSPRASRGVRRTLSLPMHFGFDAGTGRHHIWGTVFLSHAGLAVNLVGGEGPHIGAVVVSSPRSSLVNPRQRSATTSILTMVGHKEDEIAQAVRGRTGTDFGRTAVVVAGVHLRPARASNLARLFENAGRAVEVIVTQVEPAAQESGRVTGADGSGDQGRRTPAGGGRKQV